MRGSKILGGIVISALLSAALPAMAAECGPLKRVTSLDIMKLRSGRYAISVDIAGKQETLLLDTGGAFSQLSPKTVKDLGLATTRSRDGKSLIGVSGATSDQQVRLPSITLGGLRQEGAYFFVSPEQTNAPQTVPEFAGILAADFLQNFDADFDFTSGKLNLFSPDHCPGNVVYWPAVTVAAVPFTFDASGHINFRMELDGKRVNATLDTGAAETTLSTDIAQRDFGVDLNAPDVQKIGELQGGFAANVYVRRFKTLAVDGVTISNPVIVLLPDLVSGRVRNGPSTGSLIKDDKPLADMLVGIPTLSQLHLYVAYKERKLYMTASFAPPQPGQATAPPAPQAQAGAFCPAPEDVNAGATPAPASPTLSAGMGAFQRRDFGQAYANIRPIADMGNHEAERDLGIVLRQSCGRGNNKSNAASWFQKAADGGDIPAATQLGDMYMFGDGVTQDEAKAFPLLTKAANGGAPQAMQELGELYFTGRGVAQDRYQGMVWSIRAGEKGAPLALIHIGREYANGEAVPKDLSKAVFYMSIGIQHLMPGRRNEFLPGLEIVARQMSADDVKKIQQDTQKWGPGQGALAAVLADANTQRGKVP